MLDEIRDFQRKIFSKHNFTYKRYFYDKINFPRSHGLRGNAYKIKADKKVHTPTLEHGSEKKNIADCNIIVYSIKNVLYS